MKTIFTLVFSTLMFLSITGVKADLSESSKERIDKKLEQFYKKIDGTYTIDSKKIAVYDKVRNRILENSKSYTEDELSVVEYISGKLYEYSLSIKNTASSDEMVLIKKYWHGIEAWYSEETREITLSYKDNIILQSIVSGEGSSIEGDFTKYGTMLEKSQAYLDNLEIHYIEEENIMYLNNFNHFFSLQTVIKIDTGEYKMISKQANDTIFTEEYIFSIFNTHGKNISIEVTEKNSLEKIEKTNLLSGASATLAFERSIHHVYLDSVTNNVYHFSGIDLSGKKIYNFTLNIDSLTLELSEK